MRRINNTLVYHLDPNYSDYYFFLIEGETLSIDQRRFNPDTVIYEIVSDMQLYNIGEVVFIGFMDYCKKFKESLEEYLDKNFALDKEKYNIYIMSKKEFDNEVFN